MDNFQIADAKEDKRRKKVNAWKENKEKSNPPVSPL